MKVARCSLASKHIAPSKGIQLSSLIVSSEETEKGRINQNMEEKQSNTTKNRTKKIGIKNKTHTNGFKDPHKRHHTSNTEKGKRKDKDAVDQEEGMGDKATR